MTINTKYSNIETVIILIKTTDWIELYLASSLKANFIPREIDKTSCAVLSYRRTWESSRT